MRFYSGYGALPTQEQLPGEILPWEDWMETERPPVVPPEWLLYSRKLPIKARTYDDAADTTMIALDDIAEAAEAGEAVYPHGWHIHEFDDGTFGGSVTFWAPPGAARPAEKKFPWLPVVLGVGVLGAVGAAVFVGTMK